VCGRFTLHTRPEEVARTFRVEAPLFEPHFNITPSQPVLTVRQAEGRRVPVPAIWGLVPSWSREPKAIANARAETAARSPSFRAAFRQRRCLVVADGFYEWQAVGQRKQPYYYRLKGGGVFAFAGLWEPWNGLATCALLTTEANALVRQIHPRMPVLLAPNQYDAWLRPEADIATLQWLLQPYPARRMEGYPVSPRANKGAHDDGPLKTLTLGYRCQGNSNAPMSTVPFTVRAKPRWSVSPCVT
jgi:putative SOS response-associated peptidase YedK